MARSVNFLAFGTLAQTAFAPSGRRFLTQSPPKPALAKVAQGPVSCACHPTSSNEMPRRSSPTSHPGRRIFSRWQLAALRPRLCFRRVNSVLRSRQTLPALLLPVRPRVCWTHSSGKRRSQHCCWRPPPAMYALPQQLHQGRARRRRLRRASASRPPSPAQAAPFRPGTRTGREAVARTWPPPTRSTVPTAPRLAFTSPSSTAASLGSRPQQGHRRPRGRLTCASTSSRGTGVSEEPPLSPSPATTGLTARCAATRTYSAFTSATGRCATECCRESGQPATAGMTSQGWSRRRPTCSRSSAWSSGSRTSGSFSLWTRCTRRSRKRPASPRTRVKAGQRAAIRQRERSFTPRKRLCSVSVITPQAPVSV